MISADDHTLPRLVSMRAKLLLSAFVLISLGTYAQADSATWNLDPTGSAWNLALNWTPATIPNGPLDSATFALSNLSTVTISEDTQVNSVIYDANASAYTVTVNEGGSQTGDILTITHGGVTNNSLLNQILIAGPSTDGINFGGAIIFMHSSAVTGPALTFIAQGNLAVFYGTGGLVAFRNYASAG